MDDIAQERALHDLEVACLEAHDALLAENLTVDKVAPAAWALLEAATALGQLHDPARFRLQLKALDQPAD